MKKLTILGLVVLSIAASNIQAQAHWGKTVVTDGSGNGFETHSYPFGLGKGMTAEDQFGDSYGYKRGLFGINRTTKASILGNGIKVHHGLISGTSIQGESMFGDTFKSKKVFGIGPRITTVNAQGLHGLAEQVFHHSSPSYDPNAYAGNLNQNYGQSVTPNELPPAQ